jgi:hypothetical protein
MRDAADSLWSAPQRAAIGIAALVAVAFIVYWPSLTGGFLWDDDTLITKNVLVHAPDGLFRIWFTAEAIDYWPITNSSFWIEWRLWGLNPLGYHVTNLLLHVANAALAWALLRRLAIPGAFIAALVFLVHPINVESVAWITQRKNTLSLLFFLLAMLWYLNHDAARQSGPGRTSLRWYWLSAAAFLLAMLAKGSVVVFPLTMLLVLWWRHGRVTMRDAWSMAPFVVIGAGLTLVTLWFQTLGTPDLIRQVTPLQRVLAAPATVWFYLSKAVLPIHLSFVYPQWIVQVSDPRWWLPLAAALAVTGALVWHARTPWVRAVLFGWLFYAITLLPVMGLTNVYFMKYALVADHYQYIAILAVAAGVGALVDRLTARRPAQN